MKWRAITENSSERDQRHVYELITKHLHEVYMFMGHAQWLLGDGQGIALVAPAEPLWIDETGDYAPSSRPPEEYEFLVLTSIWIAPEHRGKGHFRALVRLLRQQFGHKLALHSRALEAAGWLQDDVDPHWLRLRQERC